MKKLKFILVAFVSLFVFNLTLSPAYAQDPLKDSIECSVNSVSGRNCNDNTNASSSLTNTVRNILNVFSIIVGIVAVVMIVVAGFRFVTSAGDEQAVKSARSTILYAVVGLVVVALSQVIVQFVLKETTTASSSGSSPPPAQPTPPPPPGTGRPF